MSQPPASSELTSQYAAQVTGDLERNVKEQDRVGAEIADLQGQLAALQHDHSVLLNMQQALGITPASAEAAAATASPGTKTRAKKAGTSARRSTARKSAAKKTRPTADTSTRPTLVDLVRAHLAEEREPRSTAEIAAALDKAHPDRTIKNTVVRTTVEGLVAKGLVQRTKQGSSVYYTAPDADRSADAQPQPGATE
ncbi:BlaI/MecI/CopY family transcriptional regulator [Streptomyces sp. NPDC048419]|uniref:BlaI/MecI/CopY family transcriptional regulator n=1 Tax=Streptomyces sp. NPDC048419 TaxID=3365547 RepID=UPI003717AD6E